MALPYRQATGRNIAALLNPRPLVLIGAGDDDETCFATVAWVTPVSHFPAMVAFALRARSRTMDLIRSERLFSLSTLDANDPASTELATYCGTTSGHREDKGAHVPHHLMYLEGTDATVPVVEKALSWLICKTDDIRETGDHLLVTAFVHEAQTRCGNDASGHVRSLDALLCVQHDAFASAHPL